MQLYHVTTPEAAAAILASGFSDATGTYLTANEWSGVCVSAEPLTINEGAAGEALLVIDLTLEETAIGEYEWIEDMKGYREWLVPAAL